MSTLEELLAVQEEHPSIFKIESPIRPENMYATSPRKQKRINAWQILLLLTLFWLAIEELDITDDSNFFPVVFILTLWGILQKRRILPNKARTFIDSWWHPYAVRLRAFHIKLIQGRKTPPAGTETCTCLNCGTTYTGNYCNRCGQSRNTPRYRLSNALKNIAGGFFNIDNGFGRTLLELLYRPGYMIRDFIGGKRIEYFRPFQTLFILAALYIMAVQLVDPEALSKKAKTEKTEQTDKEEIIAAKEKLTQKMEKTYSKEEKRALAITIKSLEKSLNKLEEKNDSTSATQVSESNSDDGDLIDEFVNDTSEVGDRLEKVFQNSPFLMKVWNLMKSWGTRKQSIPHHCHTDLCLHLLPNLPSDAGNIKLNYNTTEHVFIQAYIACQILLLSIIVLPFNGYAKVDDLMSCLYGLFRPILLGLQTIVPLHLVEKLLAHYPHADLQSCATRHICMPRHGTNAGRYLCTEIHLVTTSIPT